MLSLTRLQRYGVAILGVILVAVLRLALDSIFREDLPLFFFIIPIILAGWCGGLWPGVLATALSLLLGDYLFMTPTGSIFHHGSHLNHMRALTLTFTGVGFSILFDRTQKAVRALHESQRLAQNAEATAHFMVELNEALLPLAVPEQIMSVAIRMLGEFLNVERCGYAEIDQATNQFVIKAEYTRGSVSSIIGQYDMSDFGENEKRILRDHRAYIVDDIETETPEGADLSLYRRGQIRSLVCVPLKKDGNFAARMAVHQSTLRHWTREEINLITAVANRCRESVERARAVRSLRESEERYKAFIGNSSEAIWRFELEKPIPVTLPEAEQIELFFQFAYLAECNDAMARMYGYESANQIIGARIGDLLIRSDPQTMAFLRAFKPSGYRLTDVETHEIDRYGNRKYFLNNLIAVQENGALVRGWGTQRDITTQKRAAEALHSSEERFKKAFHAGPDAMVISRISDGTILEVNDSFVSLTGYQRDELIGKSAAVLNLFVDPIDRQRAVTILREHNCVRDFEFAMRRRSGEVRLILFSAEPFDLHGEHCWLTIGRDITVSKQVEAERERLLLQEKEAREQAEAANRIKDEFLATISHELRTPLTAILGWVRMLMRNQLSESQARHALDVIEQNARTQSRLVDDILDTSRIINGKFTLDLKPVAVEPILQTAVDIIRPAADAKRIIMNIKTDGQISIVRGNPGRLQQVFWNLLSNAIKFTDEDGNIDIVLRQRRNHVEISIADTGIGIDPGFLPYVFDRFWQADSTSTRRYGGMGLGLAIVRHVVELHGGTVSASSPGKGRGSTFTVRLPIVLTGLPPKRPEVASEPKLKAPKQAIQAENQRLQGVRVLAVEDDPDTLEMLKFVLAESGAEVRTAASTSEALSTLERWHPNALISDLAMPDEDGYDLIAKLRARGPEQGGDVPAAALSAYTTEEDRTRARAAGYQMHVSKPVDPEQLIAAVASLVGLPGCIR
jgi:PAS domain S-box-containing protein